MPELPEDLSEVWAHLERTYPREGCGLILRASDGTFRVRPMRNAAVMPRIAFELDPLEHLAVLRAADALSEAVVCIFHSHVGAGAHFSDEDRRRAAPSGEPLMPRVMHLVVAVDQGRATSARLYRWDGGGFVCDKILHCRTAR